MSAQKRKLKSPQPTISKFFKPISKNQSKKKVPVIHVLEDDEDVKILSYKKANENNKLPISSSLSKNESVLQQESRISSSIKRSIKKLKLYDINQSISSPGMDIRSVTTVQTPKLFTDHTETPIEPPKSMTNCTETPIKLPKSITNCENFPALSNQYSMNQNESMTNDSIHVQDSRKCSYTPLEKQVVAIKEKHKDVLLFVECGYRYRFFGEDAQIASKELNIYCHADHNFMTASIPVHRLTVHVSRLVEKGYKVGVVKQTETAALKAAGDNKNTPFTRKLTNIYTKATFIDREDCDDEKNAGHYIACINTQQNGSDSVTTLLFVNPTTGDIVFSSAENKSELETMFHTLKPSELIFDVQFKNVQILRFVDRYKKTCENAVRIEYVKVGYHAENWHEKLFGKLSNKSELDCLIGSIHMMTEYLKQYEIHTILLAVENYRTFASTNSCMKLNSSAISNLELFQNNTDNQVKGSLLWILDHTASIFGKRLLKRWLNEPLLDKERINERIEGVTDIKNNFDMESFQFIKKQLHWTLDLEAGLTSIYYRKITPEKFINTVEHIEKLRVPFLEHKDAVSNSIKSTLILDIFSSVPDLLGAEMSAFLNELNKSESKNLNKSKLFKSTHNYPTLHDCQQKINSIELNLDNHLKKTIRPLLKNFNLVYKTVSNTEYLIEVKNSNLKIIPNDWLKISSTKQLSRYRSPYLENTFKELCQTREELIGASNEAWLEFLDNFLVKYKSCREAVHKIAVFDCLMSLATVAKQPGYCRPVFTDDCIEISDGRHPVISDLLGESKQYVANDTFISRDQKVMLISGPNMGGKSCYIKQVAIICILAQIGSYVPALSAKLNILDGVYTRMGGGDDIVHGKSTFMVELEEASYIMNHATNNSLVIMDELGRGTSTHDGTAIAYATLKYFIENVKAYTLFVTHYPVLNEFERSSTGYVKNYHMAFMNTIGGDENMICEYSGDNDSYYDRDKETKCNNDSENIEYSMKSSHGKSRQGNMYSIIFLYKLKQGAAETSYGLNVARLADIPYSILEKASLKSLEMEMKFRKQMKDVLEFRLLLGADRRAVKKYNKF